MKILLHFFLISWLTIFFFHAHSQTKSFCGEEIHASKPNARNSINYRLVNSSNIVSGYQYNTGHCDSLSLFNYYPYDSADTKIHYLYFIIHTDSAGKPIGGITKADVDSLMLKTNAILNPHQFNFCYDIGYTGLPYEEAMPFEELVQYVYVGDIDIAGRSGNPVQVDYTYVMNSGLYGGRLLAHELGHNYGLGHVPESNNIMYEYVNLPGTFLDSIQIAKMHCYEETFYFNDGTNHPYYIFDMDFSNEVCNNIGKPYALFYANNYGGCVPLQVSFSDYTFFNPTKWFWDFGDGSFDTTTNPVHTYTVAGIYNVTLVVSNDTGSDTLTKNNYIFAIDTMYSLPVYEDFEDTSDVWFLPPKNWYIDNPDDLYMYFEKYSKGVPAQTGNTCIRIRQDYIYSPGAPPPLSNKQSIVSPPIDLRYVKNPYITFNHAYQLDQGASGDTLLIQASVNCGNSFTEVYRKYNNWWELMFGDTSINTLGTIGVSDDSLKWGNFFPYVREAWKKDSINLSYWEGADSVIFKFTFHSDGVLFLYLDDILISADKISGLPVADFTADTTTIYQNDTVHFTNLSAFSDTLQWFFTGATIAATQDTNPSIVYDSVGIFPVTLVVWNMFGRDTLTKLAYINVLQKIIDTIPCDSMKIIVSKNDLSCKDKNDGTVTASAFNGNSNYSYSWSNGSTLKMITGLAEGTYTVTVTDSIGCIKTAYITITEPPILSSNLAYSNVSCLGGNDGNAIVSTYGGNGSYSYLWSNGSTSIMITGLAEGTYTVTVTDSIGCIKTDSVKISYIDSLPAADFSYTDTGYAVIFTNLSTNADSSLWNFGDDSTDNSPNPNHIYFDFGIYEACLIAMNNCGADTMCKSISIIEGIKESTSKINLQIFPNPNSGTFTIIVEQSKASEISITLTNILGQKIYTNKSAAKVFKDELNLTNFSKGLYSLKVVTNNESVNRKVVYR